MITLISSKKLGVYKILRNTVVDMGITNALVEHGICHDLTNNYDCNFNGRDCCGPCTNSKYCQDCACIGEHFGEAKNNAFLKMALVRSTPQAMTYWSISKQLSLEFLMDKAAYFVL